MSELPPNLRFVAPRFVPRSGTLVVDDPASWCSLNIDHHIGNRTPDEFVAVTTPAMALRAVSAGVRPAEMPMVSTRHFDTDGVLGVWTLFNPEVAADVADVLDAACRFGDFAEADLTTLDGRRGVQVSMMLQEHLVLTARASRPRARVRQLYRAAFPLIPDLVRRPERFEDCWREPYTAFVDGLQKLLDAGADPGADVPVVNLRGVDRNCAALFSYFSAPVIVTVSADGCEILLRPRWAWEYDARMVGRIGCRDLAALRGELVCLDSGRASAWQAAGSAHSTERLVSAGSRLSSDAVADQVRTYLARAVA